MCGVCGVYGHADASNLVYLGLYALQHRGQESAGIVSSDGENLERIAKMGWVQHVFEKTNFQQELPGNLAIGHVRYSTAGSSTIENAQPIVIQHKGKKIAIAHNGNIVNADVIRNELEESGSILQTNSDTEVLLHLIVKSKEKRLEDKVIDGLTQLRGDYTKPKGAATLLIMDENQIMGYRDPNGFRPLSIGTVNGGFILTSETCVFNLLNGNFIKDIDPGQLVVIDKEGPRDININSAAKIEQTKCIFEYDYFARPDSILWGKNVASFRKELGRELAREAPAKADIVIPVPDSGIYAALGFSMESGIEYDQGLMRNHYVGRTFIEPKNGIRDFGAKVKLSPIRDILEGRRVVVVDDSIVRGNTSRKVIGIMREYGGASKVHVRISFPPTQWPCFYGIDTPTRKELIASSNSIEEIRQYIGADSLSYLSEKGLEKVAKGFNGFCTECFTGIKPNLF